MTSILVSSVKCKKIRSQSVFEHIEDRKSVMLRPAMLKPLHWKMMKRARTTTFSQLLPDLGKHFHSFSTNKEDFRWFRNHNLCTVRFPELWMEQSKRFCCIFPIKNSWKFYLAQDKTQLKEHLLSAQVAQGGQLAAGNQLGELVHHLDAQVERLRHAAQVVADQHARLAHQIHVGQRGAGSRPRHSVVGRQLSTNEAVFMNLLSTIEWGPAENM